MTTGHDVSNLATVPCGMEWHYGTIAPKDHSNPNSETGWHGIHGLPTSDASGLCDECQQDWHDNYPGYDLPRPLTLEEL
jgi:hypothetical protein